MSEYLSKQVVLQRVRNRIIEVLELFSDRNSTDIAIANLEMWEDWVDPDRLSAYGAPVFIPEEIDSMKNVSAAWELVNYNSKDSSLQWANLVLASDAALEVFNSRGKLSEDVECTSVVEPSNHSNSGCSGV